jgi:hypothetical protein
MNEIQGKQQKKEVLKDIILKLHQGQSVEQAKERFEREVGSISSTEIAEIEQSLMNDGVSAEEIKKFCNVHALLFQSALGETITKEESSAHPVYLFKLENREIEKITIAIKKMIKDLGHHELVKQKEDIKNLLERLKGVKGHYTRKEQILFPYLEKYGLFGPSKVMWGKDEEIREILGKAITDIEGVTTKTRLDEYVEKNLNPLIEEVEGMIFKEENILFPTALEKLDTNDWVEVLKESEEVGYVFIERPKETEQLIRELRAAVVEEPMIKDDGISFPSGELHLKETMLLLNTLPVDITFVDKNDKVKYFSEGRDRIFLRARSVIGREVQNCHPPESVDVVEKILKSFKEGTKDFFEFWINFKGRFVHIRYFAVRDSDGSYQGTLEVTQDVTGIRKLKGERRLLDERD